MPEEQEPVEMTTTDPTPEMDAGKAEEPKLSLSELQAELEKTRAALNKANNEAAKRRKQIEAIEAEEQKKKEAEMSEMDKLQRKYEEAMARLQKQELAALRQAVAKKVGLPDYLAPRLQGEDEDSLTEDAKMLLEKLPKEKKTPSLMATNPGGNAQPQKETLQEARNRLYRRGGDPFDPVQAAKMGGGVILPRDGQL